MRYNNRLTKRSKLPDEDDFYRHQPREMLAFTGSLLDETPKTNRIAKLHKKITAQETKYSQKRRFIEYTGILSQWFETSILDQVFSLLQKEGDRKEKSTEEEIKKVLGYIDVLLRLEGNTIRWKLLIEISEYFEFKITRIELFKYRTEAQKSLFNRYDKKEVLGKLRKAPEFLMRRLIGEFLINDPDLDNELKIGVKTGCFQVITAMKNLRYIPKDYEIYAYATYMMVKKGLTGTSGKYFFPVDSSKMRRAISNATYNIKTKVVGKVWNSTKDNQKSIFISTP